MCIKKVRAMMIFAAHFQSLCNIFLPNMKSKTKQIYRVNSESFSIGLCRTVEGYVRLYRALHGCVGLYRAI